MKLRRGIEFWSRGTGMRGMVSCTFVRKGKPVTVIYTWDVSGSTHTMPEELFRRTMTTNRGVTHKVESVATPKTDAKYKVPAYQVG